MNTDVPLKPQTQNSTAQHDQKTYGRLIVARHHESDWNKKGIWTGIRDRQLTEYGIQKSKEMGLLIADIHIDVCFTSVLVRTIETCTCMLEAKNQYNQNGDFDVQIVHAKELNERDYGDYTGKNKWDMEKILGEEGWNDVRRGWDTPVPHGETLKMVYDRVVPYFKASILPHLIAGQNVLVVSHGNAIRALMKYIEKIPEEKVKDIEMLFGGIVIYDLTADGYMVDKEVRQVSSVVPA